MLPGTWEQTNLLRFWVDRNYTILCYQHSMEFPVSPYGTNTWFISFLVNCHPNENTIVFSGDFDLHLSLCINFSMWGIMVHVPWPQGQVRECSVVGSLSHHWYPGLTLRSLGLVAGIFTPWANLLTLIVILTCIFLTDVGHLCKDFFWGGVNIIVSSSPFLNWSFVDLCYWHERQMLSTNSCIWHLIFNWLEMCRFFRMWRQGGRFRGRNWEPKASSASSSKLWAKVTRKLYIFHHSNKVVTSTYIYVEMSIQVRCPFFNCFLC